MGIEQAAAGDKRGDFQCVDHTPILLMSSPTPFGGLESPLGVVFLRLRALRDSYSRCEVLIA
jgi:hypothetical protein